ncbi:MAG: hypothetical protein JW793_15680 [Acidobacteria bacterium]|nr:hypothetical protein [Acidobacteriota bacterium]
MKRICRFLIVCMAFTACLLYAADFWEKKEFSQWSEDEVSKILKDSPWARRTYIKREAAKMPAGKSMGGPGGTPVSGAVAMGGGGMGGMGGGMGGFGGGMSGGMGSSEPTPVVVRWHSSLPVKQAVAILRYKDKVGTSEEAAEMINRQETSYIVGVIGVPGQAMMFNKDMIKAGSQLIVENKPPVMAMEVVTNQNGDNTDLYIAFPRYQNNEPLISLEDKKVEVAIEFQSGFMMTVIRKEFHLKDMKYNGKLEI